MTEPEKKAEEIPNEPRSDADGSTADLKSKDTAVTGAPTTKFGRFAKAFGLWRKPILEFFQIFAAIATVGALVVAAFSYTMYIQPRLAAERARDEALEAERKAKESAALADARRQVAEAAAQKAEAAAQKAQLQGNEAALQRDSAVRDATGAMAQLEVTKKEASEAATALTRSMEQLTTSQADLKAARSTGTRLKCESENLNAEITLARKEVARWHSLSFIVWMKDQCTSALGQRRFSDEEHVSCMVELFNGRGPAREWAIATESIGTGIYNERVGTVRQAMAQAQMKSRVAQTGGGDSLSNAVAELPKQLVANPLATDRMTRSMNVDRAIDAAMASAFGPARKSSTQGAGSAFQSAGCAPSPQPKR